MIALSYWRQHEKAVLKDWSHGMTDLIENSDYVVATRDGRVQQVTLVNPEPRIYQRKAYNSDVMKPHAIINGLIIESKPDPKDESQILTGIYTYGDMGVQDMRPRANAELGLMPHVQLLRGAPYPLQQNAHEAHKAKRNDTGTTVLSEAIHIGDFRPGNMPELATMLEGLQGAGHFSAAFKDAALKTAELSRDASLGDKQLGLAYKEVASSIRSSVKDRPVGG
jgi:hypothetical protein